MGDESESSASELKQSFKVLQNSNDDKTAIEVEEPYTDSDDSDYPFKFRAKVHEEIVDLSESEEEDYQSENSDNKDEGSSESSEDENEGRSGSSLEKTPPGQRWMEYKDSVYNGETSQSLQLLLPPNTTRSEF